jgi:protein tyrosine phosphatase
MYAGRTGMFIAIDAMLLKADTEGIVDIFNFVRKMHFCKGMVPAASQYEFIHDAVFEAVVSTDLA